ncbi:MAG: response regulator [Bdellovibrionota bacterium]
MSCKDIMIVEDDFYIRESFVSILQDEGYHVIEAENGQQALNILLDKKVEHPGLIILDLRMPVMDGRTFLEILHRDYPDDLCQIPILLATAYGSADDEMSHLPCMVEKIQKPLNISELMNAVHRHCGEFMLDIQT